MTTKVKGTEGIEFPDATVQATAADSGPAFLAKKSTTSNITSATTTVVVCDTEIFDTDNAYDNVSGKFQPSTAGYYQLNGAVCVSGSGTLTGFVAASLRKNGGDITLIGAQSSGANTMVNYLASSLIYLNGTTDYVELCAYITCSTPKIAGDSTNSLITFFSGAFVRKT